MELAELPVYAMDGHLYGLETIDKWLASKGTSPLTRERIPRTYLRPVELVEGYTAYCKAQGIKVPEMPVGTIKRGVSESEPLFTARWRSSDYVDAIIRIRNIIITSRNEHPPLPTPVIPSPPPVIPSPPQLPPMYASAAPVHLPKYERFLLSRRRISAKAIMSPDAHKKNLSDYSSDPAVLICTDFPQPLVFRSKVARYMVDNVPRTFAERLRLLLPEERQVFLRTCFCYVILNKKKLEALPEFLSNFLRTVGNDVGNDVMRSLVRFPFQIVFAEGRRIVRMTLTDYIILWAKSEPTQPLRTRLGHMYTDHLMMLPYPETNRDDIPQYRYKDKKAVLDLAVLYVLNDCTPF
jgi:hypothetical protein